MWSRFQIGSKRPLAKRKARMFCDRLLAQEVVDAEDLLLVEDLVQHVVEGDGAGQVGAERLLHDDPRPLDQLGVAPASGSRSGPPRAGRSGSAAAAVRRRSPPRPRPRRRPAPAAPPRSRRRSAASRSSPTAAARSSPVRELVARRGGPGGGTPRRSSCASSSRRCGSRASSPTCARCSRPGSSLRAARSPVAPNRMMTCGSICPPAPPTPTVSLWSTTSVMPASAR